VSFKVRIAPQLKDEIVSWGLPRLVLIQLLNRIHIDLPADPKSCLGEQVVPYADMFTFPFALHGFAFTLFVRRKDDIKEFHIVAGRCLPSPDNPLGLED
jgi:hypothetical protein